MALRALHRVSFSVVILFGLLVLAAASAAAVSTQEMVDLVVRYVEVEPTKANGDAWDAFNGKPDLKVTVSSSRKRHTTKLVNNAFAADFDDKALRISAGAVVELVVADQDVAVDDEIGRHTVAISTADIASGNVTLSGFGRVRCLVIEFRK